MRSSGKRQIRHALRDDAEWPQFIQTITDKGYRFVGQKLSQIMLLVLPFENLSGNSTEDYFTDGLTEEMITQLGSEQLSFVS